MASSDFGGNGLGMRNGHAKLTRAIAKEKSTPPRKGRAREEEVHAEAAAGAAHASHASPTSRRRRRSAAPAVSAWSVASRRRAPIRWTRSSTSAARAPSRTPTAASSSRWRAPRSRRAGASSRPTSSSRSTSARRASTATRTRARRASARSSTASRTPSARAATSSAATSRRKADADTFEAELSYLLVNQYGAFNSPVWFNSASGTSTGSPARAATGRGTRRPTTVTETKNAYERPQCSACFIQSAKDDLMSHLRPREDRGAPLQVRLGHRLELQRHPRQAGEALGRRHVVGPHVVPRGVRPRGGRDQERRHDAARRQDGLPRHGPPGDRRLHQLEGARGEEGARAHRRRAISSDFNGEAYHTISGQNSNNSVRVTDEFMRAVDGGRQVADALSHDRRGLRDARREGPLAPGRRRRVGLRRPRRAVRLDHQPLAHLPEHGAHQRVEPVLGVHVPRRHGLQPRRA